MKKIIQRLFLFLFVSISIIANSQSDVGVSVIETPSGVTTDTVFVKVWIKNYGNDAVDTIPVQYYFMGGGLATLDTCIIPNSLQSGDSVFFAFNSYFFGPVGNYLLISKTTLSNDIDNSNDSIIQFLYGAFMGIPCDLFLKSVQAIDTNTLAGKSKLFRCLVKNTGLINIDTVIISSKVLTNNINPIASTHNYVLAQTLLPDSSIWINMNLNFPIYIGANEIEFEIQNIDDVNHFNNKINYYHWGKKRLFDLAIDSLSFSPASQDTIFGNTSYMSVYFSNKGTMNINQDFTFASSINTNDTVVYNINLPPDSSGHFQSLINMDPVLSLSFIYSFNEKDSNNTNDAIYRRLIVVASIEYQKQFNSISIFPNPTTEIINIELKNKNISEAVVYLIDTQGKLVFKSIEKLSAINQTIIIKTQPLPNGVYLLMVNTGNRIQSSKIVISK